MLQTMELVLTIAAIILPSVLLAALLLGVRAIRKISRTTRAMITQLEQEGSGELAKKSDVPGLSGREEKEVERL